MKQKIHYLFMLLLMLLTGVGGVKAEEEVFYTLTPTEGSNNAYAANCDITINGMTWNVTGNSTMDPWRIGGNSITKTDRAVYSKTAMASAIAKVELTVGAASSITVNSLKLIVASDADYKSQIDEVSANFSANSTISFTPKSGTEWASNAYYKFVFNVTVSGDKNKFVEFTKAKFYSAVADNRTGVNMTGFTALSTTLVRGEKTTTSVTNDQSGWEPSYTYSSSKESVATVDENGKITAVGKGTATITAALNIAASDDNYKLGETTRKSIEIKVNNPTYTATFSINGDVSTADIEEGEAITFPTDITEIFGKQFVGWTTATIDGSTNERPATLITAATMGSDEVTYYAVFANKEGEEKSATLTANERFGIQYQEKKFTDDLGNTWSGFCSSLDPNSTGTIVYGLNSNASHYLVSPTFGNNITSVKVIAYNGSSAKNRYFYLKDDGKEVGSIFVAKSTQGKELIAKLNGNEFRQFTMTASDALQFSSIIVSFGSTTYSDYCTTVLPPVAKIGETHYTTLQEAFNAANDGETVTLLKDYDATGESMAGGTRQFVINKSITFDGGGYKLTTKQRGIGIGNVNGDVTADIDVTIKNVTVKNLTGARCIDTRGHVNSLTLEKATLSTVGTTHADNDGDYYLQPLTIGGNQSNAATINISNSTIETSEDGSIYYAIITFNPVKMNISGSTLKGWAAIYAKGESSSAGSAGSTFNIKDQSTIISKNTIVASEESANSFGAFVIEDKNVTINVENSTLDVESSGNQYQAIVSYGVLPEEGSVNLKEGNVVTLNGDLATYVIVDKKLEGQTVENLVVSGGEFNKEVPELYCSEGMIPTTLGDGKFSVKVGQYLAQVGEQKFETFAEAVAALTEENNTITLLANIEEAYTLAEGQTLNVIRGEYTLTVLAPDGNILQTAEADGVTTYSYAAPVAKIGDTMYASLAAAVAAVPADGPETTITMLADASSDQITIPADKNIVIDFAGCTVTPTGKWLIINNGALTLNNTAEGAGGITSTYKGLVDNYGTLAVNSGTYSTTAEIAFWNNNEKSTITVNSGSVSSSANVIVAENNSIVNVAGGTITATGEESYGVRSTSSKVNVSGGKVTAATQAIHLQESSTATISGDAVVEVTGEETWGIVVLSNSTLTVKDNATITSSGFAISGNGSEGEGGTTVNIEGGIVTGGSAGIYQPQSGNLNITGGTISGETGVYVKSGKLSVTGGAINGTGAKADYNFNGNGANPTGDALVIDNCGYPGGAPTASISGGTFTSINAAAVASYATTDNTAITKFVSGGTFSSAVPAEFCAEGYIPVDLGDGKYGVKRYISAPIVFHDSGEYEEKLTVTIVGENVKYTLNDGEAQTYTDPINITAKTTIKAWTELDGATSDVVTREYKIVETEKPAINLNGYYRIKGGDGNYVNVAGRKTVTFVDEAATATAAGTVIKVKTENAQVKVLRSQGVDVPGYADKAMRYVPKIVQLVAEKLGAVGEGNLLGKDGLGKIMDKFNESFDYHLYLEKAGDGYRIYGRTPSMKPVVDFYAENKANVDAKLPQLEQFINSAIDKVLEKTRGRGKSILTKFILHDVWQNMPGKLTEPTDESSTLKFYEEVLSSETNVWNFAYETAMIYWGNVKEHPKFEEYRNKLGDYAKYIDKVENIRPNFKYYIVQKGGEMDIISEGNGDIVANSANTIWTLEDRTEFSVAFNEENVLNNKYYTTLYTDFAYTLPEGVKAYKVTGIDESGCFGHAATEEIGSQSIAAQTPVLLVSETSGNQTLALAETGTAVEGNWLVGPDYLINKYNIKTAQVESLFDMAKSIMGEDFYNQYVKEYEHLMLRTAGTVNNKYFFGLSKDDCKNLEEYVCMLDNTEEAGLAFANGWETMGVNKAFLTSDIYTEIRLAQVGDVDRSGDVTIADVKALVEIVLGKVTPETDTEKKYDFGAADVNFDCKTTIADVTALVNIILGKTQN